MKYLQTRKTTGRSLQRPRRTRIVRMVRALAALTHSLRDEYAEEGGWKFEARYARAAIDGRWYERTCPNRRFRLHLLK